LGGCGRADIRTVLAKLYFLVFLLLAQHVVGQSALEQEIAALEERLSALDKERETIYGQMEGLQLSYVRQELDRIAFPTCPDDNQLIHHTSMSLCYSEADEQAAWVMHVVLPAVDFGNVSRTNDFRTDPQVTTGSAERNDYWNSGYDRGHLAPSADFRWSEKAVSESFYYSNMSPQLPELNRQSWSDLEAWVRRYVSDFQEPVFVITGGILTDPDLPKLGPNEVTIPKRYYKVVMDLYGDERKGIAFIMQNGVNEYPVASYATTINEVERLTGIDFFASLPDDEEERLESMDAIAPWIHEEAAAFGEAVPLKPPLPKGYFNSVQAKHQNGKTVNICGTIVSSKKSRKEAVYLNFDRKYPNSPFYATIWKNNQNNFSYDPEKELIGKTICVKGEVTVYDGKPRMSINKEHQITFWEDVLEAQK
jgi:endonuclease G, mitochondrial